MIYPHDHVCGKCLVKLQPYQLGIPIIELTHKGGEPYNIYSVDLYQCPVCHLEIYAGWSDPTPHHKPEFQANLERIEEYAIKFY